MKEARACPSGTEKVNGRCVKKQKRDNVRVEDTKSYQKLGTVKKNDLDVLEQMWYDKARKSSSHKQSLQIIINTVEGDYSQLSEKLSKIAEKEDKELGMDWRIE